MKRLACLCVSYVLMSFGGRGALCQPTQERSQNGHQVERDPFPGESRLSRDALVRAVLERNPTIEAARWVWQAGLQREARVTSLDDPTVSYAFAPLSLGAAEVRYGQRVQLSQRLPYPGKLGLEGEVARAEADAARYDYQAVRLQLAAMASLLFDDYYFAERALEINGEHTRLLEEFQRIATVRYVSGLAAQQDPIQAEVEAAHVLHQDVVLRATRSIIIAQINALLHRLPTARLPPPPTSLDPPETMEAHANEPAEHAVSERPELLARLAEIQARQAEIRLRERDFKPDFEAMTSFDSMWDEAEHRWMVELGVNLPIRRGRLRAAVAEAEAALRRVESERLALEDAIRLEAYTAEHRLQEAAHVVELYRSRLLPASSDQIRAARAGFETGQNSFLALIEAERNQRNVELGYQEALTGFYQRRAELDRALGRIPGLDEDEQRTSMKKKDDPRAMALDGGGK